MDNSEQRFSFVHKYDQFTVTTCISWCSQNLDPTFVGFELDEFTVFEICTCLFSGGPPVINQETYNPPAELVPGVYPGVGRVASSDSIIKYKECYRYNVSICQ